MAAYKVTFPITNDPVLDDDRVHPILKQAFLPHLSSLFDLRSIVYKRRPRFVLTIPLVDPSHCKVLQRI